MSRAAKAVALLRDIRDEIEQAARASGDRIVITRQVADAIISNTRAAARLVRELAERGDET